jgi:hypothetical protein
MLKRSGIVTTTAAMVLSAAAGAAQAADGNADRQLLQELNGLKARIQHLEGQLKDNATKAASAQAQAADARKTADSVAATSANTKKVMDKLAKGQLQIGRTNVFLNGWIEGSANYRQHNEMAGPSNSSLMTPFPNVGNAHTNEFHMGPPQTRFGINTVTDLNDDLVLKSKLEFDLLSGSNAVGTANGQSWTPRVRHAWAEIDQPAAGWHFVMGQAYSLTIPSGNPVNADGSEPANRGWMLLPGTESTSTPDDGMLAGLGSTRNLQFRVVKEIAPNAALAFSLENNQVQWGGDHGSYAGAFATTPVVSDAGFSSTSQFVSLGTMPDIVAKIGYDPTPRYHFEAWGILRQYKDTAFGAAYTDTGTTYAGGGAVSAYIKVIPKLLDVQLGAGYGSFGQQIDGAIPDVTYDAHGKPVPIYDTYVYGEIIAHPTRNLDLYLQAGIEQGKAAGVSGNTLATAYGFGNPYGTGSANGNADCMVYGGTCKQDTKRVWNVAFTPVWRILNSDAYGHLDVMPTAQYWQRELFADQYGNTARANNWAIDVAFRYWMF